MNKILCFTLFWMIHPVISEPSLAQDQGRIPTQKSTGFFRLDELEGRAYLITPEGHPFRALGLNHFHMMTSRNYDQALENIRNWGFNSGGYQAPSWQWSRIPHTRGINLVLNSSWRPSGTFAFQDVFDPGFLKDLERTIRRVCEASRENPLLVGYFWTDIPIWNRKRNAKAANPKPNAETVQVDPFDGQDWISFYQGLPPGSAGKKVWSDWRTANADADEQEFLAVIARHLYHNAHALIRKYDTHHLILGDRYLEIDMPQQVVQEALPYIDALSIQPTQRSFDHQFYSELSERYGKPIYISDHVSSYRTQEHPNTMAQVAIDSESYVEHYRNYVTSALGHPSIIGFNKCQYQDDLVSPQFLKQGLLELDGTPRPVIDGIREANRQALEAAYRLGQTSDK